ncbi:unnamed protein product [Rhizoctonia solani]|uniref:Fungal-specific transcription factor domain protein n=1 Tax=Rhizoctonia solani TaxID=456999 RepID=A0A8H3I1J1_9AGAM|nr:unnamed protein product [Rhizoctonia solani]
MGPKAQSAVQHLPTSPFQICSIPNISSEPESLSGFSSPFTLTRDVSRNPPANNSLDIRPSTIDSSPPILRFDSSRLLKVAKTFDIGWYSASHLPSTSTQSTLGNVQAPEHILFRPDCLSQSIHSSKDYDQMTRAEKILSLTSRVDTSQLNPSFPDVEDQEVKDNDPEGLTQLMWVSPTMDALAPNNFLPSVLQNFAHWVPLVMFEPLRITQCTKEHITGYFSSSDADRARIMLVGRVLGMLLNSPVINNKGQLIVSLLRADLDRETSIYTSTRFSLRPDVARAQAGRLLIKHLENIAMQAPVYPLGVIFNLLRNATPIFRYTCLDPPGLPVYLPNVLTDPESNLRHFVSLDVVLSATTGRPTLCEYEIGSSLELCDQLLQYQEHYGFQWLHGVPDQFILMLAWISTLHERRVNVEPEVLTQIERDLSNIKLLPVDSTDPALRIGRMAVQEGWRHAVYVYLYMTLYGAHSKDPRVEQALKGFMRLVNGINPGRNPDSFLAIPMIIVGVATSKQRDRATIRRRILALQECQNPASSWSDHVRILEDVWIRTSIEGRATKWTDLRIACRKVTGV